MLVSTCYTIYTGQWLTNCIQVLMQTLHRIEMLWIHPSAELFTSLLSSLSLPLSSHLQDDKWPAILLPLPGRLASPIEISQAWLFYQDSTLLRWYRHSAPCFLFEDLLLDLCCRTCSKAGASVNLKARKPAARKSWLLILIQLVWPGNSQTTLLWDGRQGKELKAIHAASYPLIPLFSYIGFFTVNEMYNSNLYFWFFPAQVGNCI